MRVAHVAAEVAPLCTTGGLGQVMAVLPDAIAAQDVEVDAFFPLCRRAAAELDLDVIDADLPGRARLLRDLGDGKAAHYFIDAPQYFDRDSLYGPYGEPYADDAARFAFFAAAVVTAWKTTGRPDVAHVHDWHAALLPHLLGDGPRRPATVLTIHNLSYQGAFPNAADPAQANFLRTGIETADVVATVSPTYAAEILTDGAGLEGSLRSRAKPIGILNGIDLTEWDPETDQLIPEPFTPVELAGKATARSHLLEALGLREGRLVVGVVSRLVEQKGIDLVIDLAAQADGLDIRLVVIGDGDPQLERSLIDVSSQHPTSVAVQLGWNRAMAHLAIAGCDALAIPSRFEPCGLTQMQAMRYGTIPIAHAVGGLADTVIDPGDDALARGEGSGITFTSPTSSALVEAVVRARDLVGSEGWHRLQGSVMGLDWSWEGPARAYRDLYRSLR